MEKIIKKCGRQLKGLPNNCVLCEELNKNIFKVCGYKGVEYV